MVLKRITVKSKDVKSLALGKAGPVRPCNIPSSVSIWLLKGSSLPVIVWYAFPSEQLI